MQSYHLGIDVAKAKLDCALRLPDGKHRNKVVNNNASGFATLLEWLQKHGGAAAHVCMEATGVYWEEVALYLAQQGLSVSVVNPAQIKAFGASHLVRTKTDRVDAQLIATFCFERGPALWQALCRWRRLPHWGRVNVGVRTGTQGACDAAGRCAGRRNATAASEAAETVPVRMTGGCHQACGWHRPARPATRALLSISPQRRVAGRCRSRYGVRSTRRERERAARFVAAVTAAALEK